MHNYIVINAKNFLYTPKFLPLLAFQWETCHQYEQVPTRLS